MSNLRELFGQEQLCINCSGAFSCDFLIYKIVLNLPNHLSPQYFSIGQSHYLVNYNNQKSISIMINTHIFHQEKNKNTYIIFPKQSFRYSPAQIAKTYKLVLLPQHTKGEEKKNKIHVLSSTLKLMTLANRLKSSNKNILFKQRYFQRITK